MSLFLNNGSQSNPSIVVLLSPGMADEQINQACQAFVDHTVKASFSPWCDGMRFSIVAKTKVQVLIEVTDYCRAKGREASIQTRGRISRKTAKILLLSSVNPL